MAPDAIPETTCCEKLWIRLSARNMGPALSVPEVGAAHGFVACQLMAGSFQDHATDLQDVGSARHLQCQVGVLLHDEHGQPLVAVDGLDELEDLADHDR